MMPLKPKLKSEVDNAEVSEKVKSTEDVQNTNAEIKELPVDLKAEVLARKMIALELKDDHKMDISYMKDENIKSELDMISSNSQSVFLGIIARCKIDGCDIHALNNELEIIKHFSENEVIETEFQKARDLAKTLDENVIAILVFNTHSVLLSVNGSLEVVK